ncbi:MAG: hypothetical protein C4321_07310, partial [Chloroflexota bacterium]
MVAVARDLRGNEIFDPVAVFSLQFTILLVSAATFRVGFRWTLALYGGITAIAIAALAVRLGPTLPDPGHALWLFLQAAPFIVSGLLVLSYVQERLARRAFYAAHLLDEERSAEHRKRLETEGMLRVLAQSIGGIVHDIGNPLTTVQMSAETLRASIPPDSPDTPMLDERADMTTDGAEMLNYL